MSFLEKTDDIEINNENPFLNCKLERKPIADNLTKIIEGTNCKKGFVFGIDSPWGTGKTTFIKMWEKQLRLKKSEDIFTIYFNAWENDFYGDVLSALIGELDKHLNNVKNVNKGDLKKAVGMIGSNIVKLITKGIVDLNDINEKLNETEGRILFNKYQEYNELKENIKKDLFEIKEKLGVEKVVFFINELDRCRPDYAIETLEKIKHLFEVEGYIFILSLDKEQLSHSVSTIYGSGMDSEGYLRRFIDLDYSLPSPNKENYLKYLMEKHYLDDNMQNTKYFWEVIGNFAKMEEVSLRDLEKLFYRIKLISPLTSFYDAINDSSDAIEIVLGSMYAYFICLNQKYNNVYKDLVTGKSKVLSRYSSYKSTSKGFNSPLENNDFEIFEKSLKWITLKDGISRDKILEILNEIDKNCNKIKDLGVVDFEIKTGLMTSGY